MLTEFRYKAQIRISYKVHMKVNTTQAITRVNRLIRNPRTQWENWERIP